MRVGQALGYHIEKIGKFEPETLARASEGDKAALDEVESILRPGSNINPNPRADIQRPSMAQDIRKGRRTEIEFMNGYIAERGKFIGVAAPTHTKLTEIVKKVERKELKAAPALLGLAAVGLQHPVVNIAVAMPLFFGGAFLGARLGKALAVRYLPARCPRCGGRTDYSSGRPITYQCRSCAHVQRTPIYDRG